MALKGQRQLQAARVNKGRISQEETDFGTYQMLMLGFGELGFGAGLGFQAEQRRTVCEC